MSCNKCDKSKRKCGCSKPVLEVSRRDKDSLVLLFNDNGVTTEYDFRDLIKDGETDTSLSIDIAKRVLKYVAEKHIDSFSAQELGSILHLADLGDVDTRGADQGSTLVYKKNNNCSGDCVGTSNQWEAWNVLDNVVSTGDYLQVYDSDGYPHALARPQNTNQFYNLGWNAGGKLSFQQPSVATTKGAGDYTLYMNATTKEIYGVLE